MLSRLGRPVLQTATKLTSRAVVPSLKGAGPSAASLPIGARQTLTQAIAPSAPRRPNSLLQAAGQFGNRLGKDLVADSAADAAEQALGMSAPTRPSMSSTIYPILKKLGHDGLSAAGEAAVNSGLASDLQENYMRGNDPGA